MYRELHCDFPNNISEQSISPDLPGNTIGSISRASATSQILASLEQAGFPCSEFKNPIYKPGDAIELIDHFLDTTTPWLGSPKLQKIIQKDGLLLALRAPYLLHSILAISASHLSYLHPEQKKYEVAATIHYQHALTSYSSQLRTGVDAESADSVIGCGYLQTMLAFENIFRASKEEAGGGGGGGVTWLRAMQGVRILLGASGISPHLEQSIWLPVFLESGGWEENICQAAENMDDSWMSTTSKTLHDLCEVLFDPSCLQSPYQQPLSILCRLIRSNMSHDTIGRFMVFIGKLPNDFVELFEQNEPRALLLMAYWCALISGVDQWWIFRSATAECRRLCASLDNASDSRTRDLLKFPASRCGYILKK